LKEQDKHTTKTLHTTPTTTPPQLVYNHPLHRTSIILSLHTKDRRSYIPKN